MEFEVFLSKNRINIMGVSILLIMFFHQMWLTSDPVEVWIHHLGYLGVEVFLLISGFGIAHSLKKNRLGVYYKNRIKRLLPACLTWGVLKVLLSTVTFMPSLETNLILELFSLSSWYIYAIVVYYIISPIIFEANKKIGWWVLLIACVITFIITYFWKADMDAPYLLEKGRWVVKRLPVFIMGMLTCQKPVRLKVDKVTILGVAFLCLNIISLHYIIVVNALPSPKSIIQEFFWSMPNRGDIPDGGRYLLDMLSVFFLCPLFAGIGAVAYRMKISSVVHFLGAMSLEIYLCHQYIFLAFRNNLTIHPVLELFLAISVSLLIAYIIKSLSKSILALSKKYMHTLYVGNE